MYRFILIIATCILSLLKENAHGQNCDCLISEVFSNSVNSCDYTIGPTVTVSNAADLRLAIIDANGTGGNSTILIADGEYQIASTDWYPYITASDLVIRSASGNRDAVILSGTGMRDVSPGVEIGIYAVGNNITIADLTIREVGNHGIATHGDNLTVYNVRIQNTYEQMLKGTSAGDGADNAIVKCSLFEYPNGIGPQFYIGGLDVHEGSEWIVSDNVFRNIASPEGSLAEHAIHFWNHASNNMIERNIIINCDRGIGFGLGNSPNEAGIIRNNMIYNDGTAPFDDVGIGLESSPFTKVYNNTIHIEYPNAIEYRFQETVGVDIANNLCNQAIRSRDGGKAEVYSNFTDAQISWYADASNGDLRLASLIPELFEQGADLSASVKEDIDQLIRPQGATHDIGAHEIAVSNTNNNKATEELMLALPNPFSEFLLIDLRNNKTDAIQIYNEFGQLIYQEAASNLTSKMTIETKTWSPGLYHILLIAKHDVQAQKLIKIDK